MSEEAKYNLVIIDIEPQITNFVYRGITESDRKAVTEAFESQKSVLKFKHDEGEVLVSRERVHSLCFHDYMSLEEEEELEAGIDEEEES